MKIYLVEFDDGYDRQNIIGYYLNEDNARAKVEEVNQERFSVGAYISEQETED